MISATDRMKRLVAAIPWIVAQDGASLDEISERFDYPRNLLVDDLREVVFFVGVPPYTPDTLIEVYIDDDVVYISYADWFSRPMKLTGPELLALLTAGETALAFDNQDQAGALARGLLKLRVASGSDQFVDVQVASAEQTALPVIRSAADDRLCVDIEHYSVATNSVTNRRIEPGRFFLAEGNWYVGGYCHLASDDRVFRVDRIRSAVATSHSFSNTAEAVSGDQQSTEMFSLDTAPRATISMPENRRRVLDGLPIDDISEGEGDSLVVTLPVSSSRWLEQLLLRIGPGVAVTESPDVDVELAAAGERLRERYRNAETTVAK